jgi:signal transduction histidine kinase
MSRPGSVRGMTSGLDARGALFDAALAVGFAAIGLSITLSLPQQGGVPPVVLALVVTHSASLFWRRRAPLAILGIVTVTAVGVVALGYPTVVLGPAALVALYTLAAESGRSRSLPGASIAAVVTAALTSHTGSDLSTVVGNVVIVGVVWFLGDTLRQRRDYVHRLEERTAELEAARDELSRAAVTEERLRIARELHDIIGHTVGAIAVQAGVGGYVIDSNPNAAKDSLARIESISRSALSEIRQLVGALRETHDRAQVEPMPTLDGLAELVADLSDRVSVDLEVDAEVRTIPPGLQLTIYRVVQEALTNVIRHARATKAKVTIRSRPTEVRVEVVDDGLGTAPVTGGHGLAGMNERVSIHGGTLEYGPLPERGFRVSATLPLRRAS